MAKNQRRSTMVSFKTPGRATGFRIVSSKLDKVISVQMFQLVWYDCNVLLEGRDFGSLTRISLKGVLREQEYVWGIACQHTVKFYCLAISPGHGTKKDC